MRPPTKRSSFFYQPLDSVLGSVGQVRVLRVLSLQRGAMNAATLAGRAGLGRAGVGRILAHLAATGVVEHGPGKRPHYALSDSNPLAITVRELFEQEAARTDTFLHRIRAAARRMRPPPKAVWLVGSVARKADSEQSDVDLAVVHGNLGGDGLGSLTKAIARIGEEFGFGISLIGFTPADLQQLSVADTEWWRLLSDAVPILGAAPGSFTRG